MRLFIEPMEPLLFRTAHPFIAGENNFALSLFPPTPETLQGAIRAAIATHWNSNKTLEEAFQDKELVKRIGQYTDYGQFRITGITLGRCRKKEDNQKSETIEPLFPMPVHILREEGGEKRQVRLLPQRKKEAEAVNTNLPDDMHLLYPDKDLEGLKGKLEPIKGWLTRAGLIKVLSSKEDLLIKEDEEEDEEATEVISNNDIYTFEPRLGIGMNNRTKTTEEGFLYQVQMVRMNHKMNSPFIYGFIVDIRLAQSSEESRTSFSPEALIDDSQTKGLLRLPAQGWITLGGERRAARFEVVKSSDETQQAGVERVERGNLLYLATPAALARGWQPKEWKEPLTKPIAVAIDRYQPIGGWLLTPGSAGGQNKTMRRCVPAGTVYFFDKSVRIPGPLTDYGWQIGYGIAYAGEW